MNALTAAPIRSAADAIEYLRATGRDAILSHLNDDGVTLTLSAACDRCGGRGFGSWQPDGGRCYACGGVDTRKRTRTQTVKSYAQAKKAADRRAVRKAEQRREEREERQAAGKAWLAARPELSEALAVEHPILADLRASALRWGSLTDKQQAFAFKVAGEVKAAPVEVTPVEGRQDIEGEVVTIKSTDWGTKLMVRVDTDAGSFRLYGSLPAALDDVARGDRVRFAAKVTPKDAGFGFYSRPTKAEKVA